VSELDEIAPAPIAVAILASDAITGEGTAAYLRGQAGLTLLAADRLDRADVVLVLATLVTDETLALMQRVAERTAGREPRFVLVGDGVRERHLIRAISWGPVSVIPRADADLARIAAAIVNVYRGDLQMPGIALGWVTGHLRAVERDVLAPNGLTAAGLAAREVEVLRLIADGLDTVEIARRLSYSERTVKTIVHGMLARLKLRNRSHAVAYALRSGLL